VSNAEEDPVDDDKDMIRFALMRRYKGERQGEKDRD
jgi:hypothetical protein